MCMSSPKPPPVQMPVETQAMKEPDGGLVRNDTRRKITDRMRSQAQTVLTSPLGVEDAATAGTTLLGGA